MSSDTTWSLEKRKRWQIIAKLATCSSLHIGSSEFVHVPGIENEGKPVDVNSVITGESYPLKKNRLPIIPGSTLKGKLRQWLAERKVDQGLLESVFGKESDQAGVQGCGGLAEFHDARIYKLLTGEQSYPYWREERQTWVMASTAIDRHTGSALHQHLHYVEAVPPDVHFRVIVSGVMEDKEVDILLAALEACRDPETGISLGAGDADGMGKIKLCGDIQANYMDSDSIRSWLNSIEDSSAAMAMTGKSYTRKMDQTEIWKRTRFVMENTSESSTQNLQLELELQFDGPFLVSVPVKKQQNDPRQPDLVPLRDNDGKPILPASSLRGALRSQAERIVRTLGGRCCSPNSPCPTVQEQKDIDKLCPVCQVFGATGWKTTLRINDFKCIQVDRGAKRQDFVAIDRFQGGGKDGAKFAIEHSERPCFTGRIELSPRMKPWGKGMLALVLRDLREGDITLGFGANKGYGHLRAKTEQVDALELLNKEIPDFRTKLAAWKIEYPCATVLKPIAQTLPLLLPVAIKNSKSDRNQFHNPYHFVPMKPPQTDSWLAKEVLSKNEQKKTSHHSHAFYRDATEDGTPLHHGRIICRLETETPLFIGAENGEAEETNPETVKDVENYQLNGALAIPATSLRGMISSLVEAASNSAMRVLENRVLSFRNTADNALRDIGMIIQEGKTKFVLPLERQDKLKHAYTDPNMMSFLEDKHSWSPQHNVVYYLPQNFIPGTVPDTAYEDGKTPGILRILGKDANRSEELQNKKHELFIKIPQQYVDTEKNRFEYERYITDHKHNLRPIPEHVWQRYRDLADERSISQKSDRELKKDQDCTSTRWLPFHLNGGERERDTEKNVCKLPIKHGDLVWWKKDHGGDRIAEISFSSIWRSRVEDRTNQASKVHSFFPAEALPFNPKRNYISPAELLFGFVEDVKEEKEKKSPQEKALSFAGKVRCSAGVLPSDASDTSNLLEKNGIILKALSSPKPPSPALYFARKDGMADPKAISKQKLSVQLHRAMGRKHYLHAFRNINDPTEVLKLNTHGFPANNGTYGYPWESLHPEKRPQLKVRVRPIVKGTAFYFHLDFSNLTEWELGLLCFALRPHEHFRHKLGMGKPIGLGTVRIDLAGLHTIDRKKRYAEDGPEDARYNQGGWTNPILHQELEKAGYAVPENGPGLDPEKCREHFLKTVDADIYRALGLLGNPENVHYPVHYPQISEDKEGKYADIEEENFKWFVDNDKEHHECLAPLSKDSESLPLLTRRREQ